MSVGEVSLDAFPETVAYVERLLHGGLGLTGIPMISTICRAITCRMPAGR
jgi:hypothetical protein